MAAPANRKSSSPIAALLASLLVAGSAAGQVPTAKDSPPTGIPITLPGGLVIVIGAPTKPAPKADAVVLTQDQYKQLLDRLERLQALVDAQQPMRPRSCELDGRVENRGRQSVVRLRATFKFTTTKPNTIVHLGCQRAQAVEVRADDGKTPLLTAAEDGLRLLAETAGDHTVRLEIDAPLTARGPKGSELGFDIGLPGAPITALTFEAPADVRRFTLTTKAPRAPGAAGVGPETEVEVAEAERFLPAKGGVPLGSIISLALSWEDPTRKTDAAKSAETEVNTTVQASEVVSEARIHLQGSAIEWKFTAPSTADVSVALWARPGGKAPAFPADRAPNVLRPDPGQSVWRLVFREPFAGDLLVTIISRQTRPRGAEAGARGPFPIGPFAVLGIPRQSGAIRVRTPSNWRATATLKGNTRREVEEGTGDFVYRYQYGATATPPVDPPIALTLTPVPGVIHARVRHELRLTETGWKLRSEIAISPARTEVEYIDIEVPAAFRPIQADPPEIVEELAAIKEAGPERQVYRARLLTPKRASFSFTLDGEYPLPAGVTSASLPLPRLLGVSERSSELLATAPPRFDLRGVVRTWEGSKPGTWATQLQPESSDSGARIRAAVERPIASADMVWRAAASSVVIRSTADVDMEPSWTRVVQRFHFRFGGPALERFHLRASRPIQGVRVSAGTLEPAGAGWDLVLPAQAGQEPEITISYTAPPSLTESTFTLPLLCPESGDVTQVVRIWSPSSIALQIIDSPEWLEAATEVVAARTALPTFVAKSRGGVNAPVFSIRPASSGVDSGPVIERARIDVVLGDGEAAYRSQFWIRDWRQDAEFLLPPRAREVEVFVQGKRVPVASIAKGNGESMILLRRPVGLSGQVVMEFRYRGPTPVLQPPTVARGTVAGDVIWTIVGPPTSLVIALGDTSGNWSPEALSSTLGIRMHMSGTADPTRAGEASVVLRRNDLNAVTVYPVPRTTWTFAWSIAAFFASVVLAWLGRRTRGGMELLLTIAFVVGLLTIPQPTALATFAAMPGLLAFAAMAVVYRWARRRYRRRLFHAPGFTRSGSSLLRPSASRPRDPTSREVAAAPVPAPSPN